MLSDRELFFKRNQVKVKTLELNGTVSEKIVNIGELPEYLQQKQGVDRSESSEGPSSGRSGGTPSTDTFPSIVPPPVNITVVTTTKLAGHFKRKIHDLVSNF